MVPRRRTRKKAQCQANARPTRCHANARRWKHRDPAGLAWSAMCCTVWHGSITGLHPYIHYYNRAAVLSYTASGRGDGIWYALEVLRRCDVLQRGACDIIAAFVGLVLWAVERAQLQEKPL